MNCFIDGVAVSSESIGPPAMNYGQKMHRTEFSKVKYEYLIAIPEFLANADSWFEKIRKEEREDRANYSKGEFPELDEFAALNFPSLDVMVNCHGRLIGELLMHYNIDLLNLVSIGGGTKKYCANTVEYCDVNHEHVRFGGIAYTSK
jgi:hypothetical protein